MDRGQGRVSDQGKIGQTIVKQHPKRELLDGTILNG